MGAAVKKAWLAMVLVGLAACASLPGGDAAMGTRPTYLQAFTDGVPNAAALSHRIYTPDLDGGYVPQGLTSADGFLFVSSYRPMPDLKSNTGPCRVFRIEAATGRAAGHFDIPAGTCTHSGGLAHLGKGRLLLADTRQLFLVDVEQALATGTTAGASKAVKIAGELRGSYATFDGQDAWIGTWTRDQPWMVLHELAHGYHHKALGYDHAGVRKAYEAAKASGSYDTVLHINGQPRRHYALNNDQEYFAEATEAYFGTNDFFPFVRAELKKHDPEMFRVLAEAWGARE